MLGVFSSDIVSPPEELVAAGSRTPSPKTTATALVKQFLQCNDSGVSIQINNDVYLAFTDNSQSPLLPKINQARFVCPGVSLLMDSWHLLMMPNCLRERVASRSLRSLRDASTQQQWESYKARKIRRTRSQLFLQQRKRRGVQRSR
ncbi:hypothetical protein ACSBR2_031935 [Camellia fascicularis]